MDFTKHKADAATPVDDGEVIDLLLQLGEQRQADSLVGGEAWAEFKDFCWAEDEAPDDALLSRWLEGKDGERLSSVEVAQLMDLIEAGA